MKRRAERRAGTGTPIRIDRGPTPDYPVHTPGRTARTGVARASAVAPTPGTASRPTPASKDGEVRAVGERASRPATVASTTPSGPRARVRSGTATRVTTPSADTTTDSGRPAPSGTRLPEATPSGSPGRRPRGSTNPPAAPPVASRRGEPTARRLHPVSRGGGAVERVEDEGGVGSDGRPGSGPRRRVGRRPVGERRSVGSSNPDRRDDRRPRRVRT